MVMNIATISLEKIFKNFKIALFSNFSPELCDFIVWVLSANCCALYYAIQKGIVRPTRRTTFAIVDLS